MSSRMDKYNEEKRSISSRTTKNQQLYKELYSNKTYTEFTDSVGDNIVDLSAAAENTNRRSNYNRTRSLYEDSMNKNIEPMVPTKTIKELFDEVEVKSYNINDVMDIARKNRTEEDEEEKKKRIKSAEYSILSDLSQEKLKEYRERKEKGISKEEEEQLDELIHTITSKSLRKKIDDELFNDLLPDSEDEETVSRELFNDLSDHESEIMDNTQSEIETTADLENGLDKSFFTRSMDLKKEDLISKDEEEEMEDVFEEEKGSVVKAIVIILVITIILGTIGYFVFKYA